MPFDLLIELYPLVPFVLEVLIAQSVYIWTSSAWTPVTGAEASTVRIMRVPTLDSWSGPVRVLLNYTELLSWVVRTKLVEL